MMIVEGVQDVLYSDDPGEIYISELISWMIVFLFLLVISISFIVVLLIV